MFILDRIKQEFKSDPESEGFDDLNYVIGNTSGMDVGQVPSQLDRRIGRMAQIGGKIMEIQITNPATFQIDRPEVTNVISQLGLDFNLHGDPNIGFTSAYATGGQTSGYNIVHRYMKRYLEQAASYKREFQKLQDKGVLDDEIEVPLGYINMHASNEMIPAREERLAQDVSVTPFQRSITNFNGNVPKDKNIYENEEFMKKLYRYFFLQIVENPWRQYERNFSNADETFREEWGDAKSQVTDKYFSERNLKEKTGLFQTALSVDQGSETDFLENLSEYEFSQTYTVELQDDRFQENLKKYQNLEDVSNDWRNPNSQTGGLFTRIGALIRDVNAIEKETIEARYSPANDPIGIEAQIKKLGDVNEGGNSFVNEIKEQLEKLMHDIWMSDRKGVLSPESKTRSVIRNTNLSQEKIFQEAADLIHGNDVSKDNPAQEAFAREKKILKNLEQGRYGDDFNKESSIFFHIMPAWMQHAEEHPGESYEEVKFIWEKIVGDDDSDAMFKQWSDFEDFLEKDRENALDVIAAVGVAYIWGHFTQVEDKFENEAFETRQADQYEIEKPELRDGDEGYYTWIRWMNKFDIRINLEAMFGDPGQLRRVWRPKDIAIACHAINKTAEKKKDGWEEPYDRKLVKFTIDLEHTSSYGVDPLKEMKKLADQEEKIAKELDTVDEDKPLADIVKTYHLTKPGWEQQQGHRHGPFARGDETLYYWLYEMIDKGFARNEDDEGILMFEVGGEYSEEMYVMKVAMDMIAQGIRPQDLDPNKVPVDGNYETVEQQLMARFYGMDETNRNREWAKIEKHAFDPLDGLLQASNFDHTWSSTAALEQGEMRPPEWEGEEFK